MIGSWARGDWLVDSDVDLVIISPDFRGVPRLKRLELLAKVGASLDSPRLSTHALYARGGRGVHICRVEGRQEVLEKDMALAVSAALRGLRPACRSSARRSNRRKGASGGLDGRIFI